MLLYDNSSLYNNGFGIAAKHNIEIVMNMHSNITVILFIHIILSLNISFGATTVSAIVIAVVIAKQIRIKCAVVAKKGVFRMIFFH